MMIHREHVLEKRPGRRLRQMLHAQHGRRTAAHFERLPIGSKAPVTSEPMISEPLATDQANYLSRGASALYMKA